MINLWWQNAHNLAKTGLNHCQWKPTKCTNDICFSICSTYTFMNNYTLDEFTHRCITYYVTAHLDDGQKWPKHVGATNWENISHLCILLVFISNYTTMHGAEHIKLDPNHVWIHHFDKHSHDLSCMITCISPSFENKSLNSSSSKNLTLVWLWHSRHWSSLSGPAQSELLLHWQWMLQFAPT
jgi:hypothetical protein